MIEIYFTNPINCAIVTSEELAAMNKYGVLILANIRLRRYVRERKYGNFVYIR